MRRTVTALSLLACIVTATACKTNGDAGGLPAPPDGPRLLIVGWDGATFRMIDPLIESGRLPNLQGLIERGSSAKLRSTVVPISSAAWASAMTGKSPGLTGVYSFFEPVEDSYDVRLVSAHSNQATPLWRIATRHGLRVNVFGVPLTYPPEPLLGTMVSGMLSPADADYAFPAGVADRLRAEGFVPDLGIWREVREVNWDVIEDQLAIKQRELLSLLEQPDWRLSIVVFKNLDVLCHRDGDWSPEGRVAQLYERLDRSLGELLEAAGPDTNVIVMSDHGFNLYPFGANLHAWMIETGYSVPRADASAQNVDLGPLDRRRAQEHRLRLNELDMSRTRAFAGVCEGNFCGIRLNVIGREPAGVVVEEEIDAVLTELTERLQGWRLAETGPPLVRRTTRGAQLYPGPFASVVPDLMVEFEGTVQGSAFSGGEIYAAFPQPIPDHDMTGVWISAGPSLIARPERGTYFVFDVTPTSLQLLGLPVYEEMTGAVRSELLVDPQPVHRVAEADDPAAGAGPEGGRPFSTEELEELHERLQDLGYVQ